MKLNRITFTGADDSVTPDDLVRIHEKYPFVEWGILTTGKPNSGKPRFPSAEWKDELHDYLCTENISVALHVCSGFATSLASGDIPSTAPYIDKLFLEQANRVQLNCRSSVDLRGIQRLKFHPREWVLVKNDYRPHVTSIVSHLNRCGINASLLYDFSGGKGLLPERWEDPLVRIYTGYAGGIDSHNIENQLNKIGSVVDASNFGIEGIETWIDIETGVRSGENGEKFDLEKVEQCIQIALPWVAERVR